VVLVVELEVVSGRACKCDRFLDLAACIIAWVQAKKNKIVKAVVSFIIYFENLIYID
jgi:hypothetical protein